MFRQEKKLNSNGDDAESKLGINSKRDNAPSGVANLDYWNLARIATLHAVGLDQTQVEVKKHTKQVQEILQNTARAVIDPLYQPKDLDKKKDELSWYNHSPLGIVARILTYCVIHRVELNIQHIEAMVADPKQYLDRSKAAASHHAENVQNLPASLLQKIEPLINKASSREEKLTEWSDHYHNEHRVEMLPPIVPFEEIFTWIEDEQDKEGNALYSRAELFNATTGIQCFCLLLLQKQTPLAQVKALFGSRINREEELDHQENAIHIQRKKKSNKDNVFSPSLRQLEKEILEHSKRFPAEKIWKDKLSFPTNAHKKEFLPLYQYIGGLIVLRDLMASHQFVVAVGPLQNGKSTVLRNLGVKTDVSCVHNTLDIYVRSITPTLHLVDTPATTGSERFIGLINHLLSIADVAIVMLNAMSASEMSTFDLFNILKEISKVNPVQVLTLLNPSSGF